ncbi:hypothetical protein BU26DRAFT_514332 [Trematosphaeria pertusa]|uniref:Uncharacterized protein n=1 Tax=Trematosphaeria pertusa TaxID=390896 RepID=A0A6A6IWG6_9PLEO|nr:uncharacterized protein BU26DRAFT_514332 [Trematosphaeria pertusa]KAF2254417.1 hypothetical protein BU26DRAFT_514332 [Trematosphaeria pertusa]
MATVIIGQYSYAFVQSGGYDYASSGGVTYYYRQTGTTQWLEYTQAQSGGTTTQTQSGYTTTQASSSSGGTVPAQYSNRLVSNVYEGQMGGINIRWGPVAIQRLQDNTSAKGISLYTMKALCEHFVYLMARRLVNQGINISTATIK